MAERDGYIPGVPCWIDTSQPDPDGACAFYGGLFGWEFEDAMPPGSQGRYVIGRIRGGDVAAIGSIPDGAPGAATWNTYVWVASADEAVAKARDAGGVVVTEPFDVMDAGRMAVLQDPTGAVFQVWEPKQHVGTRIQREPGSLCWTELVTTDTKAAQTFYTSLFGWAAKTGGAQPDEYTEFSVNGVPGAGMMAIRPEWGPNIPAHWTPYFQVSDCDASAAKARALGAEVGVPPTDIPNVGRFAMLADPQGAKFAIFTPGRAS